MQENQWPRNPVLTFWQSKRIYSDNAHERLTIGYLSRLLRLPSLAPDIITAIINGKNPPQLTAKKLMRLAPQIPIDWTEQRKLLGFDKG